MSNIASNASYDRITCVQGLVYIMVVSLFSYAVVAVSRSAIIHSLRERNSDTMSAAIIMSMLRGVVDTALKKMQH